MQSHKISPLQARAKTYPTKTITPTHDTYAMIADVLAGKIMSALSAKRCNASTESAVELFSLLDQGVSVKGVNTHSLAKQILDMYLLGQIETARLGEQYFRHITKYGLDFSTVDLNDLRKTLHQIREHSGHTLAYTEATRFFTKISQKTVTYVL